MQEAKWISIYLNHDYLVTGVSRGRAKSMHMIIPHTRRVVE